MQKSWFVCCMKLGSMSLLKLNRLPCEVLLLVVGDGSTAVGVAGVVVAHLSALMEVFQASMPMHHLLQPLSPSSTPLPLHMPPLLLIHMVDLAMDNMTETGIVGVTTIADASGIGAASVAVPEAGTGTGTAGVVVVLVPGVLTTVDIRLDVNCNLQHRFALASLSAIAAAVLCALKDWLIEVGLAN